MEQKPQSSPAAPALSHDDYVIVLRLLRTHPNRDDDNKRIAHAIDSYLHQRRLWIEDARKRKIEAPR